MGAQRWVNHPTLGRMTLEHYNEISPLIRPLRVTVDAADYDRDVAELWSTFKSAALEAIEKHPMYNEATDGWAADSIEALRKPEVEG